MNIRLNVYTDKWDCCDCAYTLTCTLMASDVWLSGSSHVSYWNLFHFHYHAQYPRALKGVRWNRDPRPKPGTQWDPRLPTFLCRVPGLGLGSRVSISPQPAESSETGKMKGQAQKGQEGRFIFLKIEKIIWKKFT